MKKILEIYDQIEEKLLVFSLAFTVILIFFQVIMRYVFNQSLSWSEELARYIFVWQCWLGVSFAFKHNAHITVDILHDALSKRGGIILRIISLTITFLFSAFLVVYGFKLVGTMMSRGTLSSGLRIPLSIVYSSLPVSSVMVCIRLMIKLAELFKDLNSVAENEV